MAEHDFESKNTLCPSLFHESGLLTGLTGSVDRTDSRAVRSTLQMTFAALQYDWRTWLADAFSLTIVAPARG